MMNIIVIVGPTCSNKSSIAYELAKKINAEIINGDAFQIYKELNIGTAKPKEKYLLDVKHHLYSFVDANKNYTVFDYQKDCRKIIDQLIKEDKNIIIVGGSGLYIRAALYDYQFIDEEKHVDLSEYSKLDNEALFNKLKEIDPEEAKLHHPNNRRRILRAIEIYLSHGRAKSEMIDEQKHELIYPAKFYVKNIDRELLYQNINDRVDIMMKEGLLSEVKTLKDKYGENIQAFSAIGYKELNEYLNGHLSLDDAINLIKQHTRNYAKRQITFIKHQFNVEYFNDLSDLSEKING